MFPTEEVRRPASGGGATVRHEGEDGQPALGGGWATDAPFSSAWMRRGAVTLRFGDEGNTMVGSINFGRPTSLEVKIGLC
jgi:hypothetical protein